MDNCRLIWMDLEMTGLNPETSKILELSVVITDSKLNVVGELESIVIHHSNETLGSMDEWNIKHHTESGLVQLSLNSDISCADAENMTIGFLERFVEKGKSPLCGNSIYQDKRFLYEYMPRVAEYPHYRVIDVTSLKILNLMWGSGKNYVKDQDVSDGKRHRANYDIHESIAELRFYRDHFLNVRND